MNINELRIGNWVNNPKNQGTQQVHQILPRLEKYLVNSYEIEFFEPIPLTKEWLLRFGFEQDRGKGYYSDGFYLTFINENWTLRYAATLNHVKENIKHVHELQNLFFALTGQELAVTRLSAIAFMMAMEKE